MLLESALLLSRGTAACTSGGMGGWVPGSRAWHVPPPTEDERDLIWKMGSWVPRKAFAISGEAITGTHSPEGTVAPSGPAGARSAPQGRRAAARSAAASGSAGREN